MLILHYRYAWVLRLSQPRGENRSATRDTNKAERIWSVEKNGAYRLHIYCISRNRFHFESTSGSLFFCTVPASRWINQNGKYECGSHQSRNEVKGLIVVSI